MRGNRLLCVVLALLLLVGCTDSTKDISKSKSLNPPAVSKNPPEPAAKSEDAVRHMQNGRPDLAMEVASKVLMTNPTDVSSLLVVAAVQRQKGQAAAARKTIDLINGNGDELRRMALKTKAGWMIEDGDWVNAEANLRSVLEKEPTCPITMRSLVELLNREGRRYEALAYVQKLIDLDQVQEQVVLSSVDPRVPIFHPVNANAIIFKKDGDQSAVLSIVYDRIFRQQFDEVLPLLSDRQFSQYCKSAAASFAAYSAAQLEDWKAVNENLVQVAADRWDNVFVWIAAGKLYESQAQKHLALDCYFQSLQIYNADTESWTLAARLLGQMKADADAGAVGNNIKLSNDLRTAMHDLGVSIKQNSVEKQKLVKHLIKLLSETGRNDEAEYWNKHYGIASKNAASSGVYQYGWIPEQYAKYSTKRVPELAGTIPAQQAVPKHSDNQEGSNPAGVSLIDICQKLGIDLRYESGNTPDLSDPLLLHQINGGGIGIIDYDLDGNRDFFFQLGKTTKTVQSKGLSGRLMRNVDARRFDDVQTKTNIAGSDFGTAVAVGDVDGDGFADLLLTTIGGQVLCHNLGDGRFENIALPTLPEAKSGVSASCAIADITGDTLPDLVVINYVDLDDVLLKGPAKSNSPTNFRASPDVIFYNRDEFVFEPVLINEANFAAQDGRGLGIIIDNLDNSIGNDIFIANDMQPNEMLMSVPLKDAAANSFKKYDLVDMAVAWGTAYDATGTPQASMGVATGDFNNDNRLDFFVTNFLNEPNVIYTGVPGGFIDQARHYGFTTIGKNTLGFGTQAIDLDGNGYQDLVILNGHIGRFEKVPFRMEPEIFFGDANGFKKSTLSSLGEYFHKPTLGRGLAYCDFDNDLRIDFVATHLDRNAAILHNESVPSNRIQFMMVGVRCDRDAIGAKIYLKASDRHWMRSMTAGSGYGAANQPLLDIGLAEHKIVEELRVKWPDGQEQVFSNLAANDRYLLIQDQPDPISLR